MSCKGSNMYQPLDNDVRRSHYHKDLGPVNETQSNSSIENHPHTQLRRSEWFEGALSRLSLVVPVAAQDALPASVAPVVHSKV